MSKLSILDLKQISQYFDIEIIIDNNVEFENSDVKKSSFIKDHIIKDFEILFDYDKELLKSKIYNGTIMFIEIILDEKTAIEQIIKKYYEYKEKCKDLCRRYNSVDDLENKKTTHYFDKEYTPFNRLFKRSRLEKLEKELDELTDIKNELYDQIKLTQSEIEEIATKKSGLYAIYINHCIKINELIDRLGEKTLRKLVHRLNINIASTNDNYFDEKEEMRIALKKWFEEENKKINSEIRSAEANIFEPYCEKNKKY